MELYEKLLAEEVFVEQLRICNVLCPEDVAGKECLIVCGMGGMGLLRKLYAESLQDRLVGMGAEKCDHIVLFNSDDLASYCDLTDVEEAVGGASYDFILVLGGMEKTVRIADGVRQLQEVCRAGGKILVVARTPKDVSARRLVDSYEDLWRYEADDLSALFGGCTMEVTATDTGGEILAAMFTRNPGQGRASADRLFHVRSGKRIDSEGDIPQGYFYDGAELDAIGKKYRTDKCSMDHNYLGKYVFFLERFRSQPLRFLELGVFQGASLRMWREYFPHAEIFGVDIEERARQYEEARIHIIQANLADSAQVMRLREIAPQIIIDDASHIVSHQLLALFTLFDVLPSGGVYILEDLETSLNPELYEEGYRDAPIDAYEVCARIARVAARKVPDDDSLYAEHINRIGMASELVSIMKGSVVFIKR